MRAKTDNWFTKYLLRIRNGTEKTFGDDYVQLPDDIVVEWSQDSSKNAKKKVQKIIQLTTLSNMCFSISRQIVPLQIICVNVRSFLLQMRMSMQ